MRRFIPGSLPAWILVLFVLALAVSQISTLVFASYIAAESGRTADLFRLMQRVTGVVQVMSANPPDTRMQALKSLNAASLAASLDRTPVVAEIIASDDELAEFSDLLMSRIAPLGAVDLRIAEYEADTAGDRLLAPFGRSKNAGQVETDLSEVSVGFQNTGQFAVSVQLSDGSWLNLKSPLSPAPSVLDLGNLAWYALVSAFIVLTCFWAVSQLTAPYRKLERAVMALGDNLNAPPLEERGSREVRSVIRAVNDMQSRLIQYVADREYLAAALAHDLRTPLTRMRLRCELPVSKAEWRRFAADVREVEQIVASVLDFARFTAGGDAEEMVEITSLVRSACDGFERAQYLEGQSAGSSVTLKGNSAALRRCVTNLIENAIVHAGSADVAVRLTGKELEVSVEDRGPGIPPEELGKVLRPFYRVDKSRNRQTGGLGLGLAIVERIARAHKGRLIFRNRPDGGLSARIVFPLS